MMRPLRSRLFHRTFVLALEQMTSLTAANSLLIFDKIEKAGGSKSNGTLADTILGLLEPEAAKQLRIHFRWAD